MLAPIVVAILVAHAPVTAQAGATQQPPASPAPTIPEEPWPPPGVFRPGAGVTHPRLIKEVRPHYRSEAMKAAVQGIVGMEAVVEADGTIGKVRVVRSLDKKYGMDEEAVEALEKWRFAPGKRGGDPVPVLIEVEMTFAVDLRAKR